ncbi:MAG: tail fiber domain-containing protein [Bacteroidia bacterium]
MNPFSKIQKIVSKIVIGLTCLIQCYSQNVNAQSVGIGATTFTPSANAMLEVQSNSKGILIPRMTDAERVAMAPTTGGDYGLLVYQTNTISVTNTAGYWYWDGTAWINIGSGNATNNGWNIDGNAGTNPNINFIGTSDVNDFVMRTSNLERVRINSSGYVGIGTVSPTQKLSVAGGINVDNDESNYGTLSSALLFGGVSTGVGIASKKSPGFNRHGLDFYTANTNQMSITQWGKVGIGTSLPADKLTVLSDVNNYGISNTDGTHILSTFLGGVGDGCYLGSQTSHNLYFYTGGGSAQMNVATNGNVGIGIGCATPWQMLTVNNGICVDNNNSNTGSPANALLFGGAGTGTAIGSNRVGVVNAYGLDFYTNSLNRMCINNGGVVGIGTVTPAATRLHVYDPSVGTVRVAVFQNNNAMGTEVQVGSIEYLHDYSSTTDFNNGANSLGLSINYAGSTAYSLQVAANSAGKPTSGSWTISSDARLKEDVHSFKDGLDVLRKIKPVYFKYNGKAKTPREYGIGVIAQEIKEVAPYTVGTFEYLPDENDINSVEQYYNYNPDALHYISLNAIKELDEKQNKMAEVFKNISDFGTASLNDGETRINYNNDFTNNLNGSVQPVVTLTTLNSDAAITIVSQDANGFVVKIISAKPVQANWIAMAKVKENTFDNQKVYTENERSDMLSKVKLPDLSIRNKHNIEMEAMKKQNASQDTIPAKN